MDTLLCEILWDMESDGICMKIRKFQIMASRGQGPRIKPGMVLAIEPMVCMGSADVEVLADNWTAVTRDRSFVSSF